MSNNNYNNNNKIKCELFYGQYHGHDTEYLEAIVNELRKNGGKHIVYLCGDSSLDSKYWIPWKESEQALNGYENILSPPQMKTDVCYYLNKMLVEEGKNDYAVVNCAVEESTIGGRRNQLLVQDEFLKKNLRDDDVIIASLGGNDIALTPTISTVVNIVSFQYLNSIDSIKLNPLSCWGINHFVDLFKTQLRNYLIRLIGDKKPKVVIICGIYYPDETQTGSWADTTLGYLGYNTNPAKLQASIDAIFKHGICEIQIPGVKVEYFPMFKYMDGKNSSDYVARVEPSSSGGLKLAKNMMINHLSSNL